MNNSTQKLIKDIAKLTAGITTITGLHSYYLTVANQSKNADFCKDLIEQMNETKELVTLSIKKQNLSEQLADNLAKRVKALHEKLDYVKESHDTNRTNNNFSLVDYFKNNKSNYGRDLDEIKKEVADMLKEYEIGQGKIANASTSLDTVNNNNNLINNFISNNNNDNSLWENYKEFINSHSDWMQSLSLTKQSAVIHITNSILVLLCSLSLITVFYGDSLINYFKLEEKYPRIAKYIQLRRKFQQYYFFINALLILLFTVIILMFNIWIFLYVD